jgi:cytoskeletal protein RodZ
VRAVVVAVVIGLFSVAAMAADHYVEVWNPPEASTQKHSAPPKRAASKPAQGAKSASQKAAKSATKATKATKAASKSNGKNAPKVASGKTKPAQVAAKPAQESAAPPGKAKGQRVAATPASSHISTATKSARTASVKPKSAAPGRELPPILG